MSTYTWYVEPQDDFTNEVISREANERSEGIRPYRDKLCNDGKTHNLWECPFQFITDLKHSQQPLRYRAWVQEGNGQIRPWSPQRWLSHKHELRPASKIGT